MTKRVTKARMNSHEVQNSNPVREGSPKSFYSKVWNGATTFITTASVDVSSLFSKHHEGDTNPSVTSLYNSEKIKNVKGNWYILAPRTPKKISG